MRSLSVALLAPLLLASTVLARSNYAPGSLDQYFRVEHETSSGARGPVLEGYVEILDASGRVVGTTTTWVLGGVPPNNRTWFSTPVPPAARYQVEILSFDWVGRGGGGQ